MDIFKDGTHSGVVRHEVKSWKKNMFEGVGRGSSGEPVGA